VLLLAVQKPVTSYFHKKLLSTFPKWQSKYGGAVICYFIWDDEVIGSIPIALFERA
jgi:hypothetical protein